MASAEVLGPKHWNKIKETEGPSKNSFPSQKPILILRILKFWQASESKYCGWSFILFLWTKHVKYFQMKESGWEVGSSEKEQKSWSFCSSENNDNL